MQTLLEHLGCRVAVCGSYAEAESLLDERALEPRPDRRRFPFAAGMKAVSTRCAVCARAWERCRRCW